MRPAAGEGKEFGTLIWPPIVDCLIAGAPISGRGPLSGWLAADHRPTGWPDTWPTTGRPLQIGGFELAQAAANSSADSMGRWNCSHFRLLVSAGQVWPGSGELHSARPEWSWPNNYDLRTWNGSMWPAARHRRRSGLGENCTKRGQKQQRQLQAGHLPPDRTC